MKNWTWLALAVAFVSVGNLAACSDDGDKCETTDDCEGNEVCDTGCDGKHTCKVPCTDDTQCAEGGYCLFDGEGCTVKSCSNPGFLGCVPRRYGSEYPYDLVDTTCYERTMYCDPGTYECAAPDLGSCGALEGHGKPAADGPLVYRIESAGCTPNDAAHCLTATDTGCAFDLYVWDPQADITLDLAHIKYVNESGTVGEAGNSDPASIDDLSGVVRVYTCGTSTPEGGFLVLDDDEHTSNAICVP